MIKTLFFDIKKDLLVELFKQLLFYIWGFVLSSYWLQFVLVLNNIFIVIGIGLIIFIAIFIFFRRGFPYITNMVICGSYLVISLLLVLLVYLFCIEHKEIQEMNLRFIHNKAVTGKTSIIRTEHWYSLNKNPVENHPYIGLVSLWEITNSDKVYVSLQGKLNWPSGIGIVLSNKETFPTEYLEYKASSANNEKLSLHLVDWKIVVPLLKGEGEIYEGKDFTLSVEIDKSSWKICVFEKAFRKNCRDLPNTTTFNYIGFKFTDNDTSSNNPYVPEIKRFDIYSMRF